MDVLAGIVVEYLVVGSTSALWILILLASFNSLPSSLPDPIVILLLPLLYVLGMLSDRFGRFLVESRKKTLEEQIQKGYAHVSTQDIHSRLVVSHPALAKQLEARRTRDRIARGILPNVPFITLALAIWVMRKSGIWTVPVVAFGGVLLYVAVLSMWKRYQTLSSTYEIHCDKRLQELPKAGGGGKVDAPDVDPHGC